MREPLGAADFPGSSRGNNLRVFVVHWTAAGGCHRARTAKVIRRHLRGSEVVMKTGYFGKQISFPPLLWVVPEWREFGVPSATRPRNTPVAIGLGRPGNFTAVFTRLLSRRIGGCKPPVGQPIPPSGGQSHANGESGVARARSQKISSWNVTVGAAKKSNAAIHFTTVL